MASNFDGDSLPLTPKEVENRNLTQLVSLYIGANNAVVLAESDKVHSTSNTYGSIETYLRNHPLDAKIDGLFKEMQTYDAAVHRLSQAQNLARVTNDLLESVYGLTLGYQVSEDGIQIIAEVLMNRHKHLLDFDGNPFLKISRFKGTPIGDPVQQASEVADAYQAVKYSADASKVLPDAPHGSAHSSLLT